jgi:serine/threonine-protein kinase ATR
MMSLLLYLRYGPQISCVARADLFLQIRACLQSALTVAALRDQALSTWLAMLGALDDEKFEKDLIDLIVQTFTVILHSWHDLCPSAQQQAHEAVLAMLRTKNQLIQESVLLIPSLQGISLMSKLESHLSKSREKEDTSKRVRAFSQRCQNENANVVLQALRELVPYLTIIQAWLNDGVMSEQPHLAIAELVRALLDLCSRFGEADAEILDLCAQCLGAIGCLDPVRVEAPRETKEIIVLSNFELAGEAVDFVVFLLETVLVKAFHSAPNPRAQGFLAYVMQELLKFCDFTPAMTSATRRADHDLDDAYGNWHQMSESARSTLAPLLSSRYVLKINVSNDTKQKYPIFDASSTHGTWLRTLVYDLLRKASGDNAKKIFGTLSRIIRGYGTPISSFLLPFVALNVIIGGTVLEVSQVKEELLAVLMFPSVNTSPSLYDNLRSCSENVFQVLDYLSKWLQAKRKAVAAKEAISNSTPYHELDRTIDNAQVASVEDVLSAIPADVIASRAVECGAYSRALFYWEQYMRQQRSPKRVQSMVVTDVLLEREQHYHRLHSIYAEIDEPDGIEGISHYIQVFEPEEQILEHEKNGRWGAAQSWYESSVNDDPDFLHTMVLDHGKTCYESWPDNERLLSLMSEAAWSTGKRIPDMLDFIGGYQVPVDENLDFNIGVGKVLLEELSENPDRKTSQILRGLRLSLAKSLTPATTTSLQSCHDQMLKLHALYEIDALSKCQTLTPADKVVMHTSLSRRLDILGSYLPDKQYLLSIRRAMMCLKSPIFGDDDLSRLWLDSAKLARKGNRYEVAYTAVLAALQFGDDSAKIEQSRLLWKSGEHRKAIQSLEGAIISDAFVARSIQDTASMQALAATATSNMPQDQNILVAKANLLLAKWLDRAGQTQSTIINSKYQLAVKSFARWEKGLYYLGKFYNKLLESNKALPPSKQDGSYLHGDHAKLVVENYLRSLVFGCKYLFETMPKLLTLWLDFGIEAGKQLPKDAPDEIKVKALHVRPEKLDAMNKQVRKYSDKIPPYMFYPALAQMITRVCHPNVKVYDVLAHIILKVVTHYPQQSLWPLLATAKSSANDRAGRGTGLLNKIKEKANKTIRNDGNSLSLRDMISKGQKLSEQLLKACEVSIGERTTGIVSLTRDLGFNKAVASCPLVVPVEKTLTASLPSPAADYHSMKMHRAFPSTSEAVVISSFTDDVLVLNSLQKPRKLTARGSDGRKYGLLCKPKDDLRKDQRLMEFNAMVNRAMKKDTECSQRRLYVRTYAVTPLNEECGIIEWVDGLKALRDIILHIYRGQGITMNYSLLRELLNQSCAKPENHNIFTNQILEMYPAVLHDWFTDTFSDPESWFAARLRYTRSAAVTSIVGNALGLGDRHGENVMLEEGTGGVFHVDFNCLFEKGLTFDKPEVVPFRLTQNMVDACGVYGVEGPFRRSAECCAKVMRASEDALLTILETFVYDPTADFMGPGGRRNRTKGVPETPKEILESTSGKLRGLLRGENVPLSVEGHVDALIRQATANLCQLYVGWLSCL